MADDGDEITPTLRPAQVASSALRRVQSAERLQALMNRSPSLRSATALAVPGSGSHGLEGQLAGIRYQSSPRTAGAGGYSPRQRVILATLPERADTSVTDDADSFTLGASAAISSPTPVKSAVQPARAAEPKDTKSKEEAAAWQDYVIGTAPALNEALERRPWLDFLNCSLRGFGQVMFMNNPVTGLVVVLALLWQSLYVGAMGCVGAFAATATAQLLELDAGARRSGLFTFNGVLVGLALATFDRGCTEAADCSTGSWTYFPGLILPVALFAAISVVFTVFLGNFFAQVWGVAAFTLPFNFAALMFLGTALQSSTFPQQSLAQGFLPASADATREDVDWMLVLEAIPKGTVKPYCSVASAHTGRRKFIYCNSQYKVPCS